MKSITRLFVSMFAITLALLVGAQLFVPIAAAPNIIMSTQLSPIGGTLYTTSTSQSIIPAASAQQDPNMCWLGCTRQNRGTRKCEEWGVICLPNGLAAHRQQPNR